MAITVVPPQPPDQSQIDLPRVVNPYLSVWWTTQTISGVPYDMMGWLVAQGWGITAISQDQTTVPPTLYYTLGRETAQPWQVLLSLCNSYTTAANEARDANEIRYNEVVDNWTDMISSSQTQFEAQITEHNAQYGVYITDLNAYLDEVLVLTDDNRQTLSIDYGVHKDTAIGYLDNLGQTEVARITEQFASTLSVQLQKLIDDGLYTSAVAADITERNHRDRDEQLQLHYDRLMREKLANEHQLWQQRASLSEFQQQLITAKMNINVMRLEGWKEVTQENMKLLAYQLDERNKLLVGLYSFVERRDDISPTWHDMTQMIAGLADAAGGWITP